MVTIIEKVNPIILGICEANIGPLASLSAIQLEGYSLEIDSRHSRGGTARAAVYVSTNASYIRRQDLEPEDSPCVWLEMTGARHKPWLLFLGYREWESPTKGSLYGSRSIKDQCERLSIWGRSWERALLEGKPLYIMGDINIDTQNPRCGTLGIPILNETSFRPFTGSYSDK